MREFYVSIKKQLETIQELKSIDWYLQQEKKPGQIVDTPTVLIELFPIKWDTHSMEVQRGSLRYRIRLLSQTAHGDENDILDTTNIGHLELEKKIYVAMNDFSADIKFILPDVHEDLNGQLMNSSKRTIQTVHKNQAELIHTFQEFECTVYDYSAIPQCMEVLAELFLEVSLTSDLTVENE